MSDFNDADFFTCIVEKGSLAKAAEAFGISPSVASKRLARLEGRLGVQLLKRTTRQQSLTEVGRFFYERVSVLQNNWSSIIEEVKNIQESPKGTLRIATPQPIASRFLMPLLAEYGRCYPNVALDILHRSIDSLPSSDADISISRVLEQYDSATMIAVPFYRYSNHLFASPRYVSKQDSIKRLNDLSHCDCLAYGSTMVDTEWYFNQGAVKPNVILKTDNTEVLISAAVNDMGIIYVPKVMVTMELERGELVSVLPELKSQLYTTVAYYPKMNFIPIKIKLFINLLKSFY